MSHIIENLEKWMTSIFTGFFVFIVLYVYKGYDIDQIESYSGHSLLFRALSHCAATSLLFFISEFYGRPYFKINTNKQYLVWSIGVILIGVNMTFLIFNYFWNWTELVWESYRLFYYEYPFIVFFPILIARLIGNQRVKTYINIEHHLVFASENGKAKFRVKPEHLLFLQSSDNYVEIFHSINGEVRKHLLRNSLKEIEKIYATSPYLKRCHRSFIVNPKNVDHIVQDSKVTTLNVGGSNIPVSKKYLPFFQQSVV